MLLGSEYEIMTKIAMNYTWHSTTGTFQFSENDYKLKFPEDHNLFYLQKLIIKGYAKYGKSNQIIVDSVLWINEFISLLQKEIIFKGYDYNLTYNLKENIIVIKLKDKEMYKFHVNFKSELSNYDNIISFVYIPTLESYIFWIDILNDPIMLDMFLAFLDKQLKSFNFKIKLSFSFFDNLDRSFISEIFNESIQNYFQDGGFTKNRLTDEQLQWIVKYYLKEDIEAYNFKKDNIDIIICKLEERIDFLSFNELGAIYYTSSVYEEFEKLEKKLKMKVSSFRHVNMHVNNKSADAGRKITQTMVIILTAINALIMYGVSYLKIIWIEEIFHSVIFYVSVVLLLIFLVIGYIIWLIIPNIRLFRFNWKLKYK